MAKHPAAVALGKLAKGHTSPAKAAASRENGKRGGRPLLFDQAVGYVRLLASYGCADEETCGRSIDISTGKVDGELCGPCEAREWLERHRLL